jgi:hypothetical protein
MSKTYRAPELVAKGAIVELTRGIGVGTTDPDELTRMVPVGTVGFGL